MKNIFNIICSVLFGDKFFEYKGRAGLLEFWVIILVYCACPFLVVNLTKEEGCLYNICLFYLILLMPWITWSVIVRRFHDINMSGWWMCLIIPIIILPFFESSKSNNRFDIEDK